MRNKRFPYNTTVANVLTLLAWRLTAYSHDRARLANPVNAMSDAPQLPHHDSRVTMNLYPVNF